MTDPAHRVHARRAADRNVRVELRPVEALLAIYELLDERLAVEWKPGGVIPELTARRAVSGEVVNPPFHLPNLDAVTTRQLLEQIERRLPRPVEGGKPTFTQAFVHALREAVADALSDLPAEFLDYRPEYR